MARYRSTALGLGCWSFSWKPLDVGTLGAFDPRFPMDRPSTARPNAMRIISNRSATLHGTALFGSAPVPRTIRKYKGKTVRNTSSSIFGEEETRIRISAGFLFFWNTKQFVENRADHKHALVGNAPVIVDSHDGKLYLTGHRPIIWTITSPGEYSTAGLRHPA